MIGFVLNTELITLAISKVLQSDTRLFPAKIACSQNGQIVISIFSPLWFICMVNNSLIFVLALFLR